VKAKVHEPLGDVHGGDARLLEVAIANYHFVHADGVVRNVPELAEADSEVVRVQHCELCGSLEAFGAHLPEIRVGPDHHSEVALE
jgi:hypothetical protein